MFEAQTQAEILDDLVARLVVRPGLTDVSEGSVISTVLATVADELERLEHALSKYRNSFNFIGEHATGTFLDARVDDLPPPGMTRRSETSATGAVLTISRSEDDTASDIIVPAGSRYGRTDKATVEYIQDTDVTIPAGSATYPGPGDQAVKITCTVPGEDGNAPAGAIDIVIASPSIISCTNEDAIGGGTARESDTRLKMRVFRYMSSLARSQPVALEWLATSHVSASNIGFQYARSFEPADTPGMTLLMVDDGSGSVGYTKPGVTVDGLIPVSGVSVVHHEGPATEPIRPSDFMVKISPSTSFVSADSTKYLSIPERGVIYVDQSYLPAGSAWKVVGSADTTLPDVGYSVFTGPIRELQRLIEGDTTNPLGASGFRAAGTRVRVLPPDVDFVEVTLHVNMASNVTTDSVYNQIKDAIVFYAKTLGPGQPLYEATLVHIVMAIRGVVNCHIDELGGALQASGAPLDKHPSSDTAMIRIKTEDITVS